MTTEARRAVRGGYGRHAPARVHFRTMLVVGVLAIVTTSCGASSGEVSDNGDSPRSSSLLSASEILKEYKDETSVLSLPPGEQWDLLPQELQGEPGHYYEAGVGSQVAQLHWFCEWGKMALSSSPVRSEEVARLAEFRTMTIWPKIDENGHQLFNEVIDSSQDGRLGPLRQYVGDNC